MNLIEALKEASATGFRSATMDAGLGAQDWEIGELISYFTGQQNRFPDEENAAEDVETTDYVEDEWILDRENCCLERFNYNGIKTGDHYKLS